MELVSNWLPYSLYDTPKIQALYHKQEKVQYPKSDTLRDSTGRDGQPEDTRLEETRLEETRSEEIDKKRRQPEETTRRQDGREKSD